MRIDSDGICVGWFNMETGDLLTSVMHAVTSDHQLAYQRYTSEGPMHVVLLRLSPVGDATETPDTVRRRYGYGAEITDPGPGCDVAPTEEPFYRILRPGEARQAGDEHFVQGQWLPVDACLVGRKIDSYNVCCRRRVVPPSVVAHAFPDSAKSSLAPVPVAPPPPPAAEAPAGYYHTHRLRICSYETDVTVFSRFKADGTPFWQLSWTLANGESAGRQCVGHLDPKDPYAVHRAVLETINKDGPCESRRATIARIATAAHFEEQERLAKILPGPGTHCEWSEP